MCYILRCNYFAMALDTRHIHIWHDYTAFLDVVWNVSLQQYWKWTLNVHEYMRVILNVLELTMGSPLPS